MPHLGKNYSGDFFGIRYEGKASYSQIRDQIEIDLRVYDGNEYLFWTCTTISPHMIPEDCDDFEGFVHHQIQEDIVSDLLYNLQKAKNGSL